MRFLVYCQHVLGIGHLVRTYEILQYLDQHQITLVLGGPRTDIDPPPHVEVVQLPPLKMGASFGGLLPVDPGRTLEEIQQERSQRLLQLLTAVQPDVLLIELFPFGRNAFRFELEPLLEAARGESRCKVVCSVRDILVERENTVKFEQRVINRLNKWFHLLLVHSDPGVIRLDATFSRMGDITIPVFYTGYICQQHTASLPAEKFSPAQSTEQPLIVASAGSGSVGFTLLDAVIKAHSLLADSCRLQVFTGPYMDTSQYVQLQETAGPRAMVSRFTSTLPKWLEAAALSISMGGYNTTMNILVAGCPALIFPFQQNHEQRLRAQNLCNRAPIETLTPEALQPQTLANRMTTMLIRARMQPNVRLNGAEVTRALLTGASERAGEVRAPWMQPDKKEPPL